MYFFIHTVIKPTRIFVTVDVIKEANQWNEGNYNARLQIFQNSRSYFKFLAQ